MKKTNLTILVALFNVILFFSFCSNNEENSNNSNSTFSIEQRFNLSKVLTIGHNTMLVNMYETLKENPIMVNGHLLDHENELDACIDLFVKANKDICRTTTRGVDGVSIDPEYLKVMVLQNFVLKNNRNQTRTDEEIQIPDFMMLFYNDFFKSDDLEISNLNDEILFSIRKVMNAYPNLTEEEIDGLFFVAGVTYNSCIYWFENADKWVCLLNQNALNRTRAYEWLWDGVKNGVKKWAKADSSGAIEAWLANKVASVTSGGMTLLGGAAIGSAIGAWDNLPVWD